MARFLALDWDHQQLHLVAANVSGDAVRIQHAVVWSETQSPNPAEGEALGKLLREHMRQAGISAAPVLACVGRDRVILKEVRHPAVAEHEEPAIIRFQVVKELSDSPEEVVIDYTPAGEVQGERRALALIARCELLSAYQELCKSAGLKLVAMTPRPFGIVSCLKALASAPVPADEAVAVLAVAERWAEFCVVRGDVVLFARALSVGPTLPGEVRRNIAVCNGQWQQHPVRAVYVAGGEEHAPFRETLQTNLGIPVHAFDPLAGAEHLDLQAGARGAFAAAVGLLHAQAKRQAQPINFVQPKQPRPPRSVNRSRVLAGALAAAVVVVSLFGWNYTRLRAQDLQIKELYRQTDEYKQLKTQAQADLKAFDGVNDWNTSNVDWLNTLYDLTVEFPEAQAGYLTKLSGVAQTRTGKEKDKEFVAKMTLTGNTNRQKDLEAFQNKLLPEKDPYFKPAPINFSPPKKGKQREFTLNVEIKKRPPTDYKRELHVTDEQRREMQAAQKGRGDFNFGGDGFPGLEQMKEFLPGGGAAGGFNMQQQPQVTPQGQLPMGGGFDMEQLQQLQQLMMQRFKGGQKGDRQQREEKE